MILTKDRRKFVKAVGVLIAIQGITWFILSVVGIVVKNSPPNKITQNSYSDYTKYSDYLARIIYDDFMQEGVLPRTVNKVIRPSDFEAFLWIYAMLSTLWIACSLDLVYSVSYKKARQSYNVMVLGILVIATSIIDFVFFALLARDFSTCPFELTTTTTTTTTIITSTTTSTIPTYSPIVTIKDNLLTEGTPLDCQLADGIVMSLAARGFVLWLINMILAMNLITIAAKATRDSRSLFNTGTNTIPRVKLPNESRKQASSLYSDDKDPSSNGTPLALSNRNTGMYF